MTVVDEGHRCLVTGRVILDKPSPTSGKIVQSCGSCLAEVQQCPFDEVEAIELFLIHDVGRGEGLSPG